MRKLIGLGAVLATLVAFAACDEDTTGPNAGPAAGSTVSFSMMVPAKTTPPAAPRLFGAGSLTLEDGTNSLVIESAELVLREIEFERVDELAGCDADEGEAESADDDACEEFKTEPILVSLPLDGSVSQQISAAVDTGTYDEIEFDVHKVSSDDPADEAFLAEHPDLEDVSVRVRGTWNGVAFEYTNDLNAEQEIEFVTPLVVEEGSGPINVTISIDLSQWFRDAGGALIDPASALKGGANENLVENNIELSIEGFEDDDGDGVPHEEDADEDDDA